MIAISLSPERGLPVDGVGHGVVDVDPAAVGDHVVARSLSAKNTHTNFICLQCKKGFIIGLVITRPHLYTL